MTPVYTQGMARHQASVVDQVAGAEVVGAVQYNRGILDQAQDVAGVDVGDHGFDLDVAVDDAQFAGGGLGFGQVGIDIGLIE